MITNKLRSFLDEKGVPYTTVQHTPAYTAHEIAASAHISGRELAKSVMVKVDGRMAMVVLPASNRVSMEILQRVTHSDKVEVAHEDEFERAFPDCEAGAMPPFGNLYGFEVYVDPDLLKDKKIAFNAGSHTELVVMSYTDYDRLVQPKLLLPL